MKAKTFGCLVLALLLFMPAAQAESEQQRAVERARMTVADMENDQAFGTAPELLTRARAVMIVPEFINGGFFLGVSLLDNVTPEMECYRNEVFGPVLEVVRVATYADAVGV